MLITVSRISFTIYFLENKISKFHSTDWIKNSIIQISFNTNYIVLINRASFYLLTNIIHQESNFNLLIFKFIFKRIHSDSLSL